MILPRAAGKNPLGRATVSGDGIGTTRTRSGLPDRSTASARAKEHEMTTQEMGSTAGGESAGGPRERAVETVAEVDAAAMHVAGVAGEEAGRVARDAKEA